MHREKRSGSLSTLELRRDKFVELRSGSLGVRLAETESEKDAARALRYRVFYEEMGAIPNENIRNLKRDFDEYDEFSDYLLVIDYNKISDHERVVGTYRLIRKENADKAGGFYSRAEYDLSVLQEYPGNLLEVGRSCVHPQYRNRSAMQLLWEGIAAYIFYYRIDILFGCASFPGTDPDQYAEILTYLYQTQLAPPALLVKALPERRVEMLRVDPHHLDHFRCRLELPPLIKGYLRLGGYVGDGAVIDQQFNTMDVAIILKTELIADKYYRHYERRLRDALEF
ncbi:MULTISPECIES: GNAT family N-acetyltransferase [unclassified Commensalibacter]|uniref:GNAT family N-acetyltransferase n=1 Tax=unclassified Commensalibacter TaxID=2630218 RepID=UPI0018DDA70B|nr:MULTISPECIES: GNAT family N-acyltransferase [unclassified Commensalibacter]MBH9969700.1 GNAT family N-acetyltransferase [Commensalibacter sp. M0265]MBH9977404.1 GNAT family N-acetyltransferase [Commensalibacter sp. M0266]MBH9992735.1 GNAT family N-acetyltransferase [Commensalibacter sp. M0270]MBI0046580.1 GNAT family N-acetyltransferase [Commensalibacter sp. M0267]MBI0055900.1 GNAT family N-acetyltransferase [Commensalibacter sp. M0268]